MRGRLYLHARGVPRTAEALAGAMLEAEFHALAVSFLTAKPKGKGK